MPGGSPTGTAAALVEAGVRLLRERPEEALRRLCSAQDAARLAGVHRQTFYRHWPDPDRYLGAVARRTLSDVHAIEVVQPLLTELGRRDITGAQDLIRTAAAYDFAGAVDDESLRTQMLLWAVNARWAREHLLTSHGRGASDGPGSLLHEEIATALDGIYCTIAESTEPLYEMILDRWHRRLVAGFTVHDFATTVTALLEGLVMRTVAQPGAVRDDLYADIIVNLVLGLTEPQDRSAAAAEQPPATQGTVEPARPAVRSGVRERNREAILEAASFEFEMRGFERTTMATIARASGLGEATVFAHFGSKNMLAVHVFARHLPGLRAAVARDLAQGPSLQAIRAHLRRLGALVRAHPGVADGLLEAVRHATKGGPPTDPDDPRLVAPLPHLLQPAIEAAQEAGDLRADLAAFEAAATLTNLVLLHAFARSEIPGEEAGDYVFSLLVEGLAPR